MSLMTPRCWGCTGWAVRDLAEGVEPVVWALGQALQEPRDGVGSDIDDGLVGVVSRHVGDVHASGAVLEPLVGQPFELRPFDRRAGVDFGCGAGFGLGLGVTLEGRVVYSHRLELGLHPAGDALEPLGLQQGGVASVGDVHREPPLVLAGLDREDLDLVAEPGLEDRLCEGGDVLVGGASSGHTCSGPMLGNLG